MEATFVNPNGVIRNRTAVFLGLAILENLLHISSAMKNGNDLQRICFRQVNN